MLHAMRGNTIADFRALGQPVTSEVKSIAPDADLILVSGVEALLDVLSRPK